MHTSALAANEAGLAEFQEYIREIFEPYQPADFHKLIPSFRWRAIASTNYDLIIERAYASQNGQTLVKSVKDGDQFDKRVQAASDPVGFYKLHGCVEHTHDNEIPLILSNEQYASYSKHRERFYGRFRDLAHECPIIFAGYSLSDPHIQHLVFDLTSADIQRPQYYQLAPGVSDIEARYWQKNRVTVINASLSV